MAFRLSTCEDSQPISDFLSCHLSESPLAGALSESSEAILRDFIGSWNQYGSPWEMWVEQYETCRQEFAARIGAEADEVAAVPSVSAGVSSLATAFDSTR